MEIKFSFGGQPDDIILLKAIELQEHLVVIATSVESKGGFAQECGAPFHCRKGDIIDGSEVLFFGRMDL